jgi:hypothetical protein
VPTVGKPTGPTVKEEEEYTYGRHGYSMAYMDEICIILILNLSLITRGTFLISLNLYRSKNLKFQTL